MPARSRSSSMCSCQASVASSTALENAVASLASSLAISLKTGARGFRERDTGQPEVAQGMLDQRALGGAWRCAKSGASATACTAAYRSRFCPSALAKSVTFSSASLVGLAQFRGIGDRVQMRYRRPRPRQPLVEAFLFQHHALEVVRRIGGDDGIDAVLVISQDRVDRWHHVLRSNLRERRQGRVAEQGIVVGHAALRMIPQRGVATLQNQDGAATPRSSQQETQQSLDLCAVWRPQPPRRRPARLPEHRHLFGKREKPGMSVIGAHAGGSDATEWQA